MIVDYNKSNKKLINDLKVFQYCTIIPCIHSYFVVSVRIIKFYLCIDFNYFKGNQDQKAKQRAEVAVQENLDVMMKTN
jgi:hypothetical protein